VARDWHLIPTPRIKTKSEAHALIAGISKNFDEARRYAELTQFEFEESPDRERISLGNLESILSRAERVLANATSPASDHERNEMRQLASQIETEVQRFKK
jgi:hypothetical protein